MTPAIMRRVLLVGVVVSFGWIAGLAWLAVTLLRVARFGVRFVAALRPELRCPECRGRTAVYARWRCRSCTGVYDGFAWRCAICGPTGWAGQVACEHCGMSIVSPLHRE
ncbi:MAG: hypothetical protein K8H88_29680 [Sandaracinaceae bacterium]|nr:hypothetical protein [Sandaracinaceae bacterium]